MDKKKPKDRSAAHPTGEMLNAQLLAMLKGWSAYGYELAQRLEEAGMGHYNKGSIYRALRQMESMGLVDSMWDTSTGGPARRMYSLTRAGTLFLENWLHLLDMHRTMLENFVEMGRAMSGSDNSRRDHKTGQADGSGADIRDE